MPTDTAMDIVNAYRLKLRQNPAADRTTLFRYILWDRFKGKMIMDSELNEMAASAVSLSDLAFKVFAREKPAKVSGQLEQSAREAIRKYFVMNYPDGI